MDDGTVYRHTLGGPWLGQTDGQKSRVFRRGKSGNPGREERLRRACCDPFHVPPTDCALFAPA